MRRRHRTIRRNPNEARFRDFDKLDWEGLQGAEEFENGYPPQVMNIGNLTFVWDKSGFSIIDDEAVEVHRVFTESALEKLHMERAFEVLGFRTRRRER